MAQQPPQHGGFELDFLALGQLVRHDSSLRTAKNKKGTDLFLAGIAKRGPKRGQIYFRRKISLPPFREK
jgi:hypothetical protein